MQQPCSNPSVFSESDPPIFDRHATHPVNVMIDRLRLRGTGELGAHRYSSPRLRDPTIVYLHACRPERAALVYDLMEPAAPVVGT